MHDTGRLPMTLFPLEFQARFERVRQKGCAPVFPFRRYRSVEFHHQPQGAGCKLAALLNLADESLHAVEDLPSQLRHRSGGALESIASDRWTL